MSSIPNLSYTIRIISTFYTVSAPLAICTKVKAYSTAKMNE